MKIKQILILAIAVVTAVAMTGCEFTAFANNPEEAQSATQLATEPELCKVQIQSIDKENLTDEITYSIYKIDKNNNSTVVKEGIKTKNGLAHIDLEQGEYKVEADTGNCTERFKIEAEQTSKTVLIENNNMYKVLSNATNVCVIGDSITIGSSADGYGWYDGLIDKFPNIETVDVAATAGQTSASIFDNKNDLELIDESSAETYIIALGINDVISRDKGDKNTTFTASEYIKNLEDLVKYVNDKNSSTINKFVFVAPFEYINKHSHQLTKYIRRDNTHAEYTIALYNWCKLNNYPFIAPMNYIKNTLDTVENPDDYTVDDVHPSYPLGTKLYSKAVYESAVVGNSGTLNISQRFCEENQRSYTAKSYSTYPIDYTQVEVSEDIFTQSYFTIKNYSTGEYVTLDKADNDTYQFEELSTMPHYYHPNDDGNITINNLPEGGYVINFEYNNLEYKAYLDTKIVFVNSGDVITNAYIYMQNQ